MEHTVISSLDTISLLIILIIFAIFACGWKRSIHSGVKFFFAGVLSLMFIYTSCNIFEWTGENNAFDIYGDLVGILIPMTWGFLFYALLQQLTEQELKNSDAKFQELFDEAPIGYYELNIEGRITRVNRTELEMLGYTFKEMWRHYVWDFIEESETSHQTFTDKIKGILPPDPSTEYTYRCKDGTLIPVLVKDKILKDDIGQIIGIRSTIQNITDHKKVIEKLKENEEFSMALFEYNPIETIVVNTKGEIINFNLPKRKSGDRLPNVRDIMYKDYAKKHELDMYTELMQCISSGKTKTFPDQKYKGKILSITIAPFPKGAIITSQDITERKFVEEALKVSEERYRELWNNAPVAYHVLNAKGIIISVNHTEAKMFGYEPDQMIGKSIFEFILPQQQVEAKKRFLKKMRGKHLENAEDRIYVAKDGRKIHVTIDDIFEYDNKGKIIGVRTTLIDITDRKKAEEEREQNFQQIKRAFEETITALASAGEIRDLYTAGHQKRVTELACAIAKEMNLPNSQIDSIRMAGLVHDIGKIAIPAEILGKPAKLSEMEMDLVKTHSKAGYDILKTVEFPWPLAKIVLQHHERIDGSGYPEGLKGNEILLEARILSIADVVEAMATYRPYHETFGIDIALEEILKNKGKLYDPQVVDICVKLFKEKRFKLKD
ncbi:MAG: PAS domain S-box protein [Candidatus Omnitrophica bacterium]|nr:PAS domain S-box protein [Candidatus Omnitrophota bacterium]MBU1888533.1 PAS domain S-box protein [Candidatus Omnitrophota bacterium]